MTATMEAPRRRGVGALLRAMAAIVLVYLAVYAMWPGLLAGWADRLLDGEIQPLTMPRDAALPFRHVYPPNDAGLRSMACGRSHVDPGWLRCRLRTAAESSAQLHEGLDAIEGWRARWSVRDLRIHAGLTPWPVANEALEWLVPIALLAALAGWPRRRELRAFWHALRAAPWLLAMPLLFAATAAIAIAVRGGSVAIRVPEWHVFLIAPFVLGPLQEELLFRGFAYGQLQKTGLGMVARCVLLTLAFVAIHTPRLHDPTLWILGSCVGVGLFWIRHRYGSLTLCIVVHALTNLALSHVASR